MVESVLVLPLVVIAVVLTIGLLVVLAHFAPHLLAFLVIGFIVVSVVVLFSYSIPQMSRVKPFQPPDANGVAPDPHATADEQEAAMHNSTRAVVDGNTKSASSADNSGIQSRTFNPDGSDAKPADEWGSKPDWVDKSPHLEQQPGGEVYVATATAGPYSTAAECDRELEGEIDRVAQTYVERKLGSGAVVRLEPQFADDHLIRARWRENVNVSVGNMQYEHALLAFDRPVQTELERLWRQAVVGPRLAYAAAGLSGLLLLVGSVYSVLKWGPGAKRSRAAA